jgi:ribosomal protein S15P/S13E
MVEEKKPEWVSLKPAEVEKIIVDLGKKGESPAKIGLILRDQHGIPKSKTVGLKIGKVLRKAGVEYESDKDREKKKVAKLNEHISKNKHDYTAKRSLTKKLWLVRE